MSADRLGPLAATLLPASFLAIGGGSSALPEVHRHIVELNWMSDATFAKVIAVAQSAPGPNLLVYSLLGWQIAGLAGFFVATASMVLPPSALAVAVGRIMNRFAAYGAVSTIRRALAPIAVGLMLSGGATIARAADTSTIFIAITCVSFAAVVFTRVSPIWCIAGGLTTGLLLHVVV